MGIWMDAVHEAQDEVETLRARAEAAEVDLAAARANLSALTAAVGSAIVVGALAPGESLLKPSGHIIVSTVSRLRARAEAAERRAEAAEVEVARVRAVMEGSELDREAHDLYEQATAADERDTPRGRERAQRLREAAEAAETKADALMARAEGGVAAAAAGGAAAVARMAEAEVARLSAEVTQARADALVLTGLIGHTALELIPEGSALDVAWDAAAAHAETISDDEVIALVRRVLGAGDEAAALRVEVERTRAEGEGARLRAELAQVRADARLMAAELTVNSGLWQSCMEAADWTAIHPDHDVIAVLSRAEIAAVIRRCAALPSIRPAGWAAPGGAR